MNVRQAFELEVQRLGMKLACPADYRDYEIDATLTIPGSEHAVGFNLSGERMLSAGAAQTILIKHELRAARERLILGWHFESLRRDRPELKLVDRFQRCFEHPRNYILTVDRAARTYRCGSESPTYHPWPEHAVIIRGGGLELVLSGPEDR